MESSIQNLETLSGWRALSKSRWLPLATVSALLVLATLLRFYRLDYWPLEGDEINTLRDSISSPTLQGARPLLFFLNATLIAPWSELDELGLRLLPALFGVLSIPLMFWLVERLINWRTASFAALLLTFNPWHVYWSQNARYYSLVFFFCLFFPFAIYIGFHKRNLLWIAVGLACVILGILAHPSAGAVAAAVALWFVVTSRRQVARSRLFHWKPVWAVMLAVIAAGVVWTGWRLLTVLIDWREFGEQWGHRGWPLALSYADWQTVGLVLLAIAGLYFLWKADRTLGSLLALIVCLPILALVLLSNWVSVSTAYLFASTPGVFACAGYFCDRILLGAPGRLGLITSATCLAIVLGESAPRLVSHYLDGSRPDFRKAAQYLSGELHDNDLVLSDEPRVLAHYLPGTRVRGLPRDENDLARNVSSTQEANDLVTWLVVSIRRRGGFNEKGLGVAAGWVRERCRVTAVFARPRLDFKHNEVQVFRCPS